MSCTTTLRAGIEGGARNVTLKSIDKLARALRVSTATLLSQASEPDASSAGECVDILVVEDDRADVEMTLQAFKRARITNPVQVVYDGNDALDFLFGAGQFAHRKMNDFLQLVLLDLHLPGIDGLEVLRRIKADERTRFIPVVVLTASRDAWELAECRRLGAETHIIKPVDFLGLSQAASRLNLAWALLKPPVTEPCAIAGSIPA